MSDGAFAWVRATLHNPTSTFTPLRAEASFRQFYRVATTDTGRGTEAPSVVLMISPPEREHNDRFEALARVFADHDLPVPAILAHNRAEGWYLLSDLGSADLEAVYGTPAEDEALALAIRTLVRLQGVQDDAIEPYTAERFADELGIFDEWFASRLMGLGVSTPVADVFRLLVERTRTQRQCCVHRDYHCRNLLFDPAHQRLGIVDFQDALVGPVSYDLASLLHDCYHEFADADVTRWIDYYLDQSEMDLDPSRFAEDVDYMAVQRQLKAVGIFTRLKLRDGKTTHLTHIPPVLDHLRLLTRRHPPLEPLADWLCTLDPGAVNARIAGLEP